MTVHVEHSRMNDSPPVVAGYADPERFVERYEALAALKGKQSS